MATAKLPIGLDRARHLERGHHSALPRRIGLSLLALACLLGLFNLFGQRTTTSRADGSAASLTIESPERLRGGLVFTTQITVTAHQKLNDAQVRLSGDWFKGMTFNGIAPQAESQSSSADGITFDYGSLDAGESMPIWISWQVNPTTLGLRTETVAVSDGASQLVSIRRSRWVFP
jgi:hypothetical protein